MSLAITNLNQLDATKTQESLDFITQLVQEEFPTLDVKRGPVHDLLLYFSSILAQVNQDNIDRVRQSSSLAAIAADPTLADTDVVDNVLSNYRVTRQEGTEATGHATIVVDAAETVVVPGGAIFETNGKSFKTTQPFTGVTSQANVSSASDKVLENRGDGTYSFIIDLNAVDVGTSSMVKKDTLLIPQFSILNFVKSYATSDFVNGTDTETNSDLIVRLQEGLAAKTLSNRVNISALIRDTFPSLLNISVIGYGDAEMLRDQHSAFPVSGGGRADIYVRTQEQPQLLGVTKTATLIQKTTDGKGIWQFSITRSEAPGFYDVTTIKPLDADESVGTYAITAETRSNNTTNIVSELTPDLATVQEGAYSRYQTATIQFKDSDTNTSALTTNTSTADYAVTIRVMPDIAAIQTLVGGRSVRNYAGDALVKGAVPCFVSLSFTLQGKAGEVIPDANVIKQDLAKYINNTGFTGRLHASSLDAIISSRIVGKVAVSAIDMFAQIRRPDGTVKPLRSSEVLVIPDEPTRMVTSRTTIFVIDPRDIAVSAETVNIPEI